MSACTRSVLPAAAWRVTHTVLLVSTVQSCVADKRSQVVSYGIPVPSRPPLPSVGPKAFDDRCRKQPTSPRSQTLYRDSPTSRKLLTESVGLTAKAPATQVYPLSVNRCPGMTSSSCHYIPSHRQQSSRHYWLCRVFFILPIIT